MHRPKVNIADRPGDAAFEIIESFQFLQLHRHDHKQLAQIERAF